MPITPPPTLTIKERVEEEFGVNHIMVKVASCESGLRQFNSDGSVLSGRVNPLDKGIFQINEHYHLESSIKLGLDVHTIDGNIAYARHLYNTAGTTPWYLSEPCWG